MIPQEHSRCKYMKESADALSKGARQHVSVSIADYDGNLELARAQHNLIGVVNMIEGNEVVSARGGVAAGPAEAARIGARIIEQGGNAADAAAATALACCMLQPASTGIGGYVGCAVVKDGASGKVYSVDANAEAPAGVTEDMFNARPPEQGVSGLNENEYRCSVPGNQNVHGAKAVAIPGMAAAIGTIWEQWGRLEWADIVAPSQQLLEAGFPYAATAAHVKGLREQMRQFPATEKHLMPEGREPDAEDIWHRPDMEWTLQRLSQHGWRDFYQGEVARRIADHIQEHGGVLTFDDLAAYEARITSPLTITYRGARLHTPILPNGGLSVLQNLKMWEQFDVPEQDSVEFWHRFLEVSKLTWRDRLTHLADPRFSEVPQERLLSADYCHGRTETIRNFSAHVDRLKPAPNEEFGHGTLHLSAADSDGCLVSFTISQGMGFGSLVTVPGTGIILGHGMCRLDPRPGRANSIAPGKRVLNNTGTLLIETADRDIAVGLPGGRKIISAAATIAMRLVDYGAGGYEAATAARGHVQISEPALMNKQVPDTVRRELLEMGHSIDYPAGVAGGCHAAERLADGTIRVGGNTWAAAAD